MPFQVIYADPCWEYKNKKTGGSHKSGAAQKYNVLTPEKIAALPVRSIADSKNGAVLALWATVPFGQAPYEVMDAWGFTFKTEWFWHKTGRMGTGYWTRGEVEKLLIGIRGTVPAWRSSLDNWIEAAEQPDTYESVPEGHSQKPEAVIRRIETLTVNAGRRCELFASKHSAEIAARAPAGLLNSPWECFGLDLGHDFTHPGFWDMLRQLERPEASALVTGLADVAAGRVKPLSEVRSGADPDDPVVETLGDA